MQLKDALALGEREVVAFVGGGGKTTAMFLLAAELTRAGRRVVTTTTTRIFASQIALAPYHIAASASDAETTSWVQQALGQQLHVLVTGATTEGNKAAGIAPLLVDALHTLDEVDAVLVEADGSRMRPFKAPAAHEPVLAATTTLLVPVVGIDVVGKPLNDEHVHRAGRVAELAHAAPGAPVTPEIVARVLAHSAGGMKGRPPTARAIALINKVENEAQRLSAETLAQALLQFDALDAAAIGALRRGASPVSGVWQRVAAVILAAGGSTRMEGRVKQLLPWGDATLVRNAVESARAAKVSEIIVVTGNRADEVQPQVAETGARLAHNPDWASGRASSVRAGLAALGPKTAAAIFINADQPFLSAEVIDRVIEAFTRTRAPLVVPVYDGKTGSPVLFARELFSELCALEGEQGGRDLLARHRARMAQIEMSDRRAALDVDTPQEYAAALAAYERQRGRGA